MSTYFLIPARKGSKGVPHKNRILLEKTVSKIPKDLLSKTFVSTDDQYISAECERLGVNCLWRSKVTASDTASMKSVAMEFIRAKALGQNDTVVILYLTYPERQWSDVERAMEFFNSNKAKSLLCKKNPKTHPYLCLVEMGIRGKQLVSHNLYRRQDYPKCFEVCHMICMFKVSELGMLNNNMYNLMTVFMEVEDTVDVDTPEDLSKVENVAPVKQNKENKMRLGVSYSVFDGADLLLKKSIEQIRPHVDYVVVLYQTKSWFGNQAMQADLDAVEEVRRLGLADKVEEMKYQNFARTPIEAKRMESAKREFGRQLCAQAGCTHHITMDVDEFYVPAEFAEARRQFESGGYTVSCCKIKTYYKSPTEQVVGYEDIDVPMFCRIEMQLGKSPFISIVDSTRSVRCTPNDRSIFFQPSVITMHHMSGVRSDEKFKYANTSRIKMNRSAIGKFIEDKRKLKTITVDNVFNI